MPITGQIHSSFFFFDKQTEHLLIKSAKNKRTDTLVETMNVHVSHLHFQEHTRICFQGRDVNPTNIEVMPCVSKVYLVLNQMLLGRLTRNAVWHSGGPR